jgi:hypothetical protein
MKSFAFALVAAAVAVRGSLDARQNNRNNIQDSLVLDPSVLCTACTDNGQNPPVDQQSPSLTSNDNFISFCKGKTLTNGQQLVQGSCNGVVIGDIIPSSNMPAAKISFPKNGGTFEANKQFTATINIKNMVTGQFTNAQSNYYGAPQQLQGKNVVGHSHLTVQKLSSIDSTDLLDTTLFAFFKGINTAAVNGVLTVDVTDGLPPGVYRFCTMNTTANHTPVTVAVAQHGALDDCIYATATAGNGGNNGGNANNGGGNGNNNGQNSNKANSTTSSSAATSTSFAAAATSSAAANNGGNNNGGNNGGRNRFRGGRGGRRFRRPQ